MPGKIDTVALAGFIVVFIAKVAFGNTGFGEIFGSVPAEVKSLV